MNSKKLFYLLIIALPINLGLHFILPSAYVHGLLIDYLIPTLFVQDILAVLLIIFWIRENPKVFVITVKDKKHIALFLFLYILLLSTLLAPRFVPSFYAFLRWVLYALVSLYVGTEVDIAESLKFIAKVFCGWLLFFGILAAAQYLKQGAVFNNYLILGEQPYSSATPQIEKENVFGSAKVPAYGLFRHPNAFGGFLAIALIVILYFFRKKIVSTRIFICAFLSGTVALILTFSYFAWLAFLSGVFLILIEKSSRLTKFVSLATISVSLFGLFLSFAPLPKVLIENPSIFKRAQLLDAGYRMVKDSRYIFGVGLNSSTVVMEYFLKPTNYLRFAQPSHNTYILIAAEAGISAALLFIFIIAKALVASYKKNYLIYVCLLQIVLLSSFDHYFVTIQQPFLLMWILLGASDKKTWFLG